MAIGESAGLLFKIKADESDAVRGLKNTKQEADALTTSTGGLAQGFADMINPASLATAAFAAGTVALTAFVSVSVQVTQALFDAAKGASDFGSEIFDASQKTGLSAETLSALKYAAEQAGSSFEQVTKGVEVFGITLGQAAAGNEKAQEKLKALNVTATDLDGALAQVFKTIADAKTPTDQLALATEAFGKKIGPDLIPLIKDANGNFTDLIKKAKDLGITIDDDAAEAADRFGDALDTLDTQFAGLGRQIGFIFMPIFTDAMEAISRHLAENQENFEAWANTAQMHLIGVQQQFGVFEDRLEEFRQRTGKTWIDIANDLLEKTGPMVGRLEQIQKLLGGGVAAEGLGRVDPGKPTEGRAIGVASTLSDSSNRSSGSGARAPRDNAARDAERQLRQDLQAELRTEQINLDTIQRLFTETIDGLIKRSDDVTGFIGEWNAEMLKFGTNLKASLGYIEEREKALLEADSSEAERQLLAAQQLERRRKLEEEFNALRTKTSEEFWAKQDEASALELEAQKQIWAVEQERFKAALEAAEKTIVKTIQLPTITGPGEGEGIFGDAGTNIFDKWTDSLHIFIEELNGSVGTVDDAVGGIADSFINAFDGMTNAMGSLIEQYVLYGETGPAVMKKILASALASIAAEAAVQAIYATALGFVRLAQHDYVAAGQAFTSAAIFAAVALAAGLAGRAIAGDSFKQQTASATGRGGGSSGERENEDPRAIQRESAGAFTSGRDSGNPFERMANRIEVLVQQTKDSIDRNSKALEPFETASPGAVVQRGVGQNARLITATVVDGVGKNSEMANRLTRNTRI